MIEHVTLRLHDDDPRVEVILHEGWRTLTPAIDETQLRTTLLQEYVIKEFKLDGNKADVLVDYREPEEVDFVDVVQGSRCYGFR